ncbi:MAG: FAD-dependent thymidylate synthase [Halanaerobiales bacterium]
MEPKVTIEQFPVFPLAIVKSVTNIFGERNPDTNLENIYINTPNEELEEHFRDLLKSDLQAPFEFLNFIIRFDNVTRAFTHQLVRTRTATYAQQSMRFINMEGFDYRNSCKTKEGKGYYDITMEELQQDYKELIEIGEHPQDARGILPTNIGNTIMMKVDYRTLLRIAGHRLCRQAQGEWRPVIRQIKEQITEWEPVIGEGLQPGCEHTGYCIFGSDFDRMCGKYPNKKIAKEIVKKNWEPKDFDPDNDYL